MNRLHRAARRLSSGSAILVRPLGAWLGPGEWRTAARRLTGAVALGWLSWAIVDTAPGLLWLAAAAWGIAAWRTHRGEQVHDQEPTHEEHRAVFLAWLDELTGGRNGIHLAELYERMRERPAAAHFDDAQLRQILTTYEVPVRRTLRVDGVAGRSGVARHDIEALLAETGSAHSPTLRAPSPEAESGSDLLEPPGSPGDSPGALRPAGRVEEDLEDHVADALGLLRGEARAS